MMKILIGGILCNISGFALLVLMLRETQKENIPVKAMRLLVIVGCLLMPPVVALQTVAGYAGELSLPQAHPLLLSEIVLSAVRLTFIEELCKYWGNNIHCECQ